jgi:Ran GTPase-activating protein (RanGAP) involved in mRNA processing and transport
MVKGDDHNCLVSAGALNESAANDRIDLSALQAFLQVGEARNTQIRFACGTMQPDGRLDMCKQSLGSTGLSELEKALSASSLVKHMLLGTNWLMSEGARTVGNIIARNTSLETVYLGCNGIESAGLEHLCNGLMANSTVSGLWLKRNPIGAEGAALIATLLEKTWRHCRSRSG